MSRGYGVLLVAPTVLSLMLSPAQVSAQHLGGPGHSLSGALSEPSEARLTAPADFGYPDSADFADQLVVVLDVATPAWDLLNRLARCTCSLTPSLRYPRGPGYIARYRVGRIGGVGPGGTWSSPGTTADLPGPIGA